MGAIETQLTFFFTTYGLKIVGAILILIIGRILSGIGRKTVTRVLEKSKTDPAVVSFAGSLTYVLILTLSVLAALAKFGIQTASFVAILGAAGFAIGFALQGSLANFAAGVLILVLRPWVAKEDYWAVRCDLTWKIKEAFDQNDIEIPFPQRVVHAVAEKSEG